MEKGKPGKAVRVVKIILGVILIALGLYFSIVGMLCTQVDGVHILGYTLMPALAFAAFVLAYLLLRKKRIRDRNEKRHEEEQNHPTGR